MLWENARNEIQLDLRQCLSTRQEQVGRGGHREAWGPFLRKAWEARRPGRFRGAKPQQQVPLFDSKNIRLFFHSTTGLQPPSPNKARFLSLRGLVANESPFDPRSWEIAT